MAVAPEKLLAPLAARIAASQRVALLEALLEGFDEAELLKHARRARRRVPDPDRAPQYLIEEAARLLPKAADFLRRAAPRQRQLITGCSDTLIALAAQQAVDLHGAEVQWQAEERQAREEEARSRRNGGLSAPSLPPRVEPEELEQARQKAREVRRHAAQICQDARRLLVKVAGPDADLSPYLPRLGDGSDAREVIKDLTVIGRIGEKLLELDHPQVSSRAVLFGLTPSALEEWRTLGVSVWEALDRHEDLMATQKQNARREAPLPRRQAATQREPVGTERVDRELGVTVVLISHVVGAFESGHRSDPRIPRLHSMVYAKGVTRRKRRRRRRRRRPVERA